MHNPWNENLPACAIRIEPFFCVPPHPPWYSATAIFYQSYIGSCMMCKAQMNQHGHWNVDTHSVCNFHCYVGTAIAATATAKEYQKKIKPFCRAQKPNHLLLLLTPPSLTRQRYIFQTWGFRRWNNDVLKFKFGSCKYPFLHHSVSGSLYRYPQQLSSQPLLCFRKDTIWNWHGTSKNDPSEKETWNASSMHLHFEVQNVIFRGCNLFLKSSPEILTVFQ